MRYVIDVSTALRWINSNAVGIVRTEREIANHFINNSDNVKLTYYDRETKDFRNVRSFQIKELFPGINADKLRASNQDLDYNQVFVFLENDVIISAGLQWDIDFLSAVYVKKMRQKIYLVQVVYDIIPIIMPEYCVPGMDILFPKFIMDTVWTADIVYAISNSTKNDFLKYAQNLKISRTPPVRIIRLGCDMPDANQSNMHDNVLRPKDFVLYVSTIEPRKNHKMLFDIWRILESSIGENVPKLIFVGSKGWNTENFFISLENCTNLYPNKIVVMSDVSDEYLQWLYSNALFTVYPSLYEGWGLPVAESLARGTPCICSSTSSMPEVAAEFCDLIDPYDLISWKNTILNYISDTKFIENKSNYIKENYKIETWREAISSFKKDVENLTFTGK